MVTPFKILVADDSAFMRKTISDLINEDPNLEVIGEATDGSEAITLARGFKPDIALLDILMPSMNGLEAMQILLADSTMPIIILSSINPTTIDSSIQALMLGAADYIIKPTLESSGDTSKFKEMLIKKIYDILKSSRGGFQHEREDESSTPRTFRQAAVDQVFAFGKYLNDVGKDKKRASPKEKNHAILKKPRMETCTGDSGKDEHIIIPSKDVPISTGIDTTHDLPLTTNHQETPCSRQEGRLEHEPVNGDRYGSTCNAGDAVVGEPVVQSSTTGDIVKGRSDKENPSLHGKLIEQERQDSGETRGKKPRFHDRSTREQARISPRMRGSGLSPKEPGIIVIGASVGGPKTIKEIISRVPPDLQAPVLVVQHMEPEFMDAFVRNLQESCLIPIKMAEQGERVLPGVVYVAPGNKHLRVSTRLGKARIVLTSGKRVNFCRPSIDELFKSVAAVYGKKACGILLTGMGHDGVDGLQIIKNEGGTTIAESRETALLYGIPKQAIARGIVDHQLANHEIPRYMLKHASRFS